MFKSLDTIADYNIADYNVITITIVPKGAVAK